MSSRLSARVCAVVCALVVLLFSTSLLQADDCTFSGGVVSCNAVFTTSGQSMFGFGQSEAIYHNTFGTSWNAGGKAGGIYHASFLGINLGDWGAEVRARTSGNVGLTLDFRANGGTVNASAPAGATLSLPDTQHIYRPGELVTISSTNVPVNLTSDNFGFTTQSPTLAASAQFGFQLAASVGATLCVAKCAGFDLGFDTGQQTIPIFSFNEALNGTRVQDISIDNSGLSIFGKSIASVNNALKFEGDISRYVGLPANTWTVNADGSPDATTVQTTSQTSGNLALASGTADEPLLSTTLDVAKVLTNVGGVALSSGSLADIMPPGTPGIVKDIGELVDFTLVKATVGVGLELGQNFSMQAPEGAVITLNMKSGDVDLPSLTFRAGETVQFRMPDAQCTSAGCVAAPLTITPTITVDPMGFSSRTSLNVPLMFGLEALGLSFAGLDIGPLIDWEKNFNLGSISLFTKNFELGGFNSINAGSYTFSTTLETSGTPISNVDHGRETLYYSYKDVGPEGLTLQGGSGLLSETLVGSTMRPADGLARANVTMGGDSELRLQATSTVESMDIVGPGGDITSGAGVNTFANTTVDGKGSLYLTAGANGTLVLKDSQFTNLGNLEISAQWNGSGFNTGTLVLDHSTLTTREDAPYPSNAGTLLLQNGSYASIKGKFYFYSEFTNPRIDITTGSTLESNWIKNAYGTINVEKTGTLNVGVIEKGTLNVNGGTANLRSLFGVDEINVNGGVLAFYGVGNSENTSGPIHFNGGLISVAGRTSLETPISGHGELRVLNGAELQLISSYWSGSQDHYFGPGSELNVAGTLSVDGQRVHAADAIANVSGTLALLPESLLEVGELNVAQTGTFSMAGAAHANAEQIRNLGEMAFDGSNTLTSGAVITNVGTIHFLHGDTEITAPGIESFGGLLQIDSGASLSLSGKYVQQDGSAVINGVLAASSLELNGGTLSGSGAINAAVANIAGVVGPGNSAGTLTIFGDYTQGTNGMLEIEISSLSSYDHLSIFNGDANLDGTLRFLVSANLFADINPGDAFNFLSIVNGTRSGMFSQVQFDYLGGELPFGFGWELIYGSNGASLIWSRMNDYGPLAVAIADGTTLPTTFNDLGLQGLSPELWARLLQENPGLTEDQLRNATFSASNYVPENLTPIPTVPEPGSLLLLTSGLFIAARYLRRTR